MPLCVSPKKISVNNSNSLLYKNTDIFVSPLKKHSVSKYIEFKMYQLLKVS